jgi:TPR repeat protein
VSRSSQREVITFLKDQAKRGGTSAAFILARLYQEGCGVEQSLSDAFKWYKHAAERGLSEAFYFVAAAYAFGDGVKADQRKASVWFRKAAESGDLDGRYMHGLRLFEGKGQRRDTSRGMRLLLQTARDGSMHAMDYLAAYFLERGQMRLAERWASKAADRGDPAAAPRLHEIRQRLRDAQGAH